MSIENDTKRCPYCGEEIKSTAIKCKHCGEFLNEDKIDNSDSNVLDNKNTGNKVGLTCAWVAGVILLLGIIGSFIPDDTVSTPETTSSSNNYSEEDEYPQTYQPVTGKYSGFGGMNVAFSNLGGQSANCLENGAGKSLVNQIEAMFQESSPQKNQVLYSISNYNPTLKFEVSNPRWAENVEDFDRCIADITFKNYKPDTIAGYKGYGDNATPYTIDEAQFGVTYYVSKRGDKYKASIRAVGCDPIEGYYD
ncbi:MAG: zinc ribbon domain-containing protein [Candidatus Gastranaerophilales bacterium]|nr:zinc ribbon domain-containing protein [Candidatus Gastranaerophilales bacterium]MCM1338882.1 zinc ribbon domain-containing protein [Muribaculaceae bacterium]